MYDGFVNLSSDGRGPVAGTVNWFNVKRGYAFINWYDTRDYILNHQMAITRNNPRKNEGSVVESDTVELDGVVGEAANVIRSDSEPQQRSPYASGRRPFQCHWFLRQRPLSPVFTS